MNFYKHHIGDYAQATAHLTFVEDAAYVRLLRKYYDEERPIPTDLKAAQRLVGARTRDEKSAVETVLKEFFSLEADGWHNKRADAEIAEVRTLEDERDERRANEAERQRRHRERRKELFDQLRTHGIVPKFDEKTEALEAMLSHVTGRDSNGGVRVTSPDLSRVTGGGRNAPATANQTPDARHQTKNSGIPTPEGSLSADPPAAVGTPHGRAAAALNRTGLRVTSQNPNLIAACAEGVTVDALLEVRRMYPDKPAGYVIQAARSIHAERATATPRAGPSNPDDNGPRSQAGKAIFALEALKSHEHHDSTATPDGLDLRRDPDGPSATFLPGPRSAARR